MAQPPLDQGAYAQQVTLARIRRLERDEAWIQAARVPAANLTAFQRAFEQAFEACLKEAQSVPLGEVPSHISCIGKVDRCPDVPDPTMSDGCPAPAAPQRIDGRKTTGK